MLGWLDEFGFFFLSYVPFLVTFFYEQKKTVLLVFKQGNIDGCLQKKNYTCMIVTCEVKKPMPSDSSDP